MCSMLETTCNVHLQLQPSKIRAYNWVTNEHEQILHFNWYLPHSVAATNAESNFRRQPTATCHLPLCHLPTEFICVSVWKWNNCAVLFNCLQLLQVVKGQTSDSQLICCPTWNQFVAQSIYVCDSQLCGIYWRNLKPETILINLKEFTLYLWHEKGHEKSVKESA